MKKLVNSGNFSGGGKEGYFWVSRWDEYVVFNGKVGNKWKNKTICIYLREINNSVIKMQYWSISIIIFKSKRLFL